MKNIKYIFAFLTLGLLAISCENDGGDSKLDLEEGAVPNIKKIATNDSFINLLAINEGEEISIGFTVDKALGNVSSMDIVLFYTNASGTSKATLATGVSTFPQSYILDQNDLMELFDNLNSAEDFSLGDKLTVSADLHLTDGRIVKILNDNGAPNYGQDILNSTRYSVIQVYNVSCPSDLAGTYNVISSGASTDSGPSPSENPISNYPATVTITATGGGTYTVSDIYGGLYILWYDIYGIDESYTSGSFVDVCDTISGEFKEPFGTTVILTGTVNPDGTLSMHWVNGYGDFGDSIYTKVD
jgi:hypothetical protein